MILELLTPNGRKKKVKRAVVIPCPCGQSLPCPSEVDPWTWIKSDDAVDFLALHEAHGAQARINFKEID